MNEKEWIVQYQMFNAYKMGTGLYSVSADYASPYTDTSIQPNYNGNYPAVIQVTKTYNPLQPPLWWVTQKTNKVGDQVDVKKSDLSVLYDNASDSILWGSSFG